MYDITDVFTEAEQILSILDPDLNPEACGYFDSLLNGGVDNPTPYKIASTLLCLDRPDDLPDVLINFITDLFELEINEGNSDAMNDLGEQYYGGWRGFEQNFDKAIHYYRMASQHGSRQAQENLGYCYYYGRDGKPDYEKAFHYFALGAFDGHLVSLYKIGDMYLNGLYVEKNEVEAFCIYLRCLQTMTEEAESYAAGPVFLRLGRMYLEGLGTEKDPKSALACYQRAEFFLYDTVKNGNDMYRKSLMAAIDGQREARAALVNELPDPTWTH